MLILLNLILCLSLISNSIVISGGTSFGDFVATTQDFFLGIYGGYLGIYGGCLA